MDFLHLQNVISNCQIQKKETERNCEKTLQTGKQSAILHKDDMILLEEWAAKPTLLYNV